MLHFLSPYYWWQVEGSHNILYLTIVRRQLFAEYFRDFTICLCQYIILLVLLCVSLLETPYRGRPDLFVRLQQLSCDNCRSAHRQINLTSDEFIYDRIQKFRALFMRHTCITQYHQKLQEQTVQRF
jgi:hypothetical protein